jgi:hypothetical protein
MKKERVTVLDKIGCWETMAHPFNPGYIAVSHWEASVSKQPGQTV